MRNQKDPKIRSHDPMDKERTDMFELLPDRIIEQVRVQIEILEDIYRNRLLKDRLVLGGACALIYVHLERVPRIVPNIITDLGSSHSEVIPRVTTDIDADYRHSGEQDWNDEKEQVVAELEEVLNHWGRTTIRETERSANLNIMSEGKEIAKGGFKVEVNFMRRYPLLGDVEAVFKDPLSNKQFPVLTIPREQSFANKWRTMLSRNKASDIFDTFHIAQAQFEWDLFMRCAVIETMLELTPRKPLLHGDILARVLGLDIERKIMDAQDLSFRPLVLKGTYTVEQLQIMRGPVLEFSRKILEGMTEMDKAAIELFFTDLKLTPRDLVHRIRDMIDPHNIFREQVLIHPQLYDQISRIRSRS